VVAEDGYVCPGERYFRVGTGVWDHSEDSEVMVRSLSWGEGVNGLVDRFRAPHHIPPKASKELEESVIGLKRHYFTFSAKRLKELFSLPLSEGAMYRIWREHKLIKRKKKYLRQRNLREVKRRYKVLEKLEMDTKRLDDIEEMYSAYYSYRLPRYQFTARDVRTGGTWIAYAEEGSLN